MKNKKIIGAGIVICFGLLLLIQQIAEKADGGYIVWGTVMMAAMATGIVSLLLLYPIPEPAWVGIKVETVIFKRRGITYEYKFYVEHPNFWDEFSIEGIEFKLKYCEADNRVIVYEKTHEGLVELMWRSLTKIEECDGY